MKIHSAVQDVTDERNEADVKRRFRMIVVLRPDTSREQRDQLIGWLKAQNVDVHISEGKVYTVLGLVGNTGNIDEELVESLSIVDSVKHVSEPFKKSNRKFHPENWFPAGLPARGTFLNRPRPMRLLKMKRGRYK